MKHSHSNSSAQVFGDTDADGFYHGESGGLSGFVPSNMVAEIPVDDEYLKHLLMQQGFLPVDHTGTRTPQSSIIIKTKPTFLINEVKPAGFC